MEQIKDFCKEKYPFIIVFIWAFVASFIGNIFVLFATEVALFAFALICGAKLSFDIGDVLLGLGMFFFYFFDGRSFVMSVVLASEVLIIYQLGKIASNAKTILTENAIIKNVFIIAAVFWLFGIVDYMNSFIKPEFVNSHYFPYPWRYDIIPKTQHEFWFVLSSSLLPLSIIGSSMKKYIRISIGIAGIIGIICSLCKDGRMNVCIFVISFLVSIILFKCSIFIKNKKQMRVIICFIISLIIVYFAFINNAFGMYDIYKTSFWSKNGGIIHNIRFRMWIDGLRIMARYPWGGNHIEAAKYNYRFAHNSWIDIGVYSGVIPFVLIALFSAYIGFIIICIIRNEQSKEKYVAILAYLGVFLYNSVEPAIIANRVFWFTLVLISGLLMGMDIRKVSIDLKAFLKR